MRALGAAAERAAHPRNGALPHVPCADCGRDATVLTDRPDGAVVRHGSAVAKAHAADTDTAALAVRVAVAAHPLLAGILLPPITLPAAGAAGAVTTWPCGTPVDPEAPAAAPWEEAAALLAGLHSVRPDALPGPLPPMRGPAKAALALARMREALPGRAGEPVLDAWRSLPGWARAEAPPPRASFLCHGDLHLGQLVRHPADDGPWQLIDVDDLGRGDPAWDLARPAAWYAAGLLAPDTWARFLGAYRAAGGPAVCREGDPWPELDVPARALTVQTAALALVKSAAGHRPLDEAEQVMLDSCARIADLPAELAHGASS
ncbi:phosphotransferase family protein [Streptomyces sp. NBC_00859]|uniref:phosphotransferase family protein n=1 Tax=Streptomyces sp. NBC_00859 TaxID=2903682 RepID=UPI00386AFAA0|nr:aminoglycoside phosphotransferase family protein [Streptomyces sp. NBC_00859]